MQRGRLVEKRLSRKLVSATFQDESYGMDIHVGHKDRIVVRIGRGRVLPEKILVSLYFFVIAPGWVAGLLEKLCRDQSFRSIEPRGLQHGLD